MLKNWKGKSVILSLGTTEVASQEATSPQTGANKTKSGRWLKRRHLKGGVMKAHCLAVLVSSLWPKGIAPKAGTQTVELIDEIGSLAS